MAIGNMEYNVSLSLHILAAIFFVGNIITAAFWKVRADRTGDAKVIAHTNLLVNKADMFFTAPGVIVLIVTGLTMVMRGPWSITDEGWLLTSILLLAASILIWALVLVPTQKRMAEAAAKGVETGAMPASYRAASKRWAMFGGIATLLPVIIVFLMVLKPF